MVYSYIKASPGVDETLDEIDEARQAALHKFHDKIKELLDLYEGPGTQCKEEEHCDQMVLGGLLKALRMEGILPFPTPPFTSVSWQNMASKLRPISPPSLCDKINSHRYHYEKKCGVGKAIQALLPGLENTLEGLDLEKCSERMSEG